MKNIKRKPVSGFKSALLGLLSLTILFVLPHWGATAMLVGSALAMVVSCFVWDFAPSRFDPQGTRARAGFICLTAACVIVAAYYVVQSVMRGHLL
jgi:hypothetical protein